VPAQWPGTFLGRGYHIAFSLLHLLCFYLRFDIISSVKNLNFATGQSGFFRTAKLIAASITLNQKYLKTLHTFPDFQILCQPQAGGLSEFHLLYLHPNIMMFLIE